MIPTKGYLQAGQVKNESAEQPKFAITQHQDAVSGSKMDLFQYFISRRQRFCKDNYLIRQSGRDGPEV